MHRGEETCISKDLSIGFDHRQENDGKPDSLNKYILMYIHTYLSHQQFLKLSSITKIEATMN